MVVQLCTRIRLTLRGCPVACVILSLVIGCSGRPPTYPASGVVKFTDGQPMAGGRIELRSLEHPYTARGAIDQDGHFQLTTFKQGDGAIAGKHQVIVIPSLVLNTQDPREHLGHTRPLNNKLSRYATTWLEVHIDSKGDNQGLLIEVE